MRLPRRINIAVDRRWNPLRAGYAGATVVYIMVFMFFGGMDAPWPLVLLGIAVGFVLGTWLGGLFTTWLESRRVGSAGGRHRGDG